MPNALILVTAPILHPVAAAAGDVLAWYPAVGINVLRETRHGMQIVRSLPYDNAGALGVLLCDGAITPFSEQDVALVRPLVQAAARRRLERIVNDATVSRQTTETPGQVA